MARLPRGVGACRVRAGSAPGVRRRGCEAPSKVCPPAKGPVHQDPKSARPTCHKGGHDHAHAKTYDFKRHYAWHCPMRWDRRPEARGWHEPYRREREQACRRESVCGRAALAGPDGRVAKTMALRMARARRVVQAPLVAQRRGIAGGTKLRRTLGARPVAHGPAIPRGYMPGGPADAGGGMADGTAAATGAAGRLNVPVRDMAAPDAPLKLTNRKTGATLVVGEPFRMRGTGAPYRIVASQSGRYFAGGAAGPRRRAGRDSAQEALGSARRGQPADHLEGRARRRRLLEACQFRERRVPGGPRGRRRPQGVAAPRGGVGTTVAQSNRPRTERVRALVALTPRQGLVHFSAMRRCAGGKIVDRKHGPVPLGGVGPGARDSVRFVSFPFS